QVMPAAGTGLLHRIPARPGQQRPDRHHQGVGGGGGGDRHRHRRLVQRADGRGWARVTVTVMVGLLPVVATLPTVDTTPGVTRPVGKVMATLSPACTCDCCAASRAMVTTCRAEVAASAGPAAGAPRAAGTVVTRIADGNNTACPSGSVPVCGKPSRACSLPSAYPVAAVKYFEAGSSCARVAQPSATRARLSCRTSAPCIPSARARQAGTRPYSKNTGVPLPTRYSTWPWRITCPAAGSQVIVPPWPVTE